MSFRGAEPMHPFYFAVFADSYNHRRPLEKDGFFSLCDPKIFFVVIFPKLTTTVSTIIVCPVF